MSDDPVIAALAERARLETAHAEAVQATQELMTDEALEAQLRAAAAVADCELALFDLAPTTRSGALALLRFCADDLAKFSGHDAEIRTAILNALAVL